MRVATKTLEAINRSESQTPRMHLGGSEVGKPCARELWYSFRWSRFPQFEPRMLRLFDRGNREEEVFEKMLKDIGCEVYTHDGDGNQFRILDFDGHFGGSLDGVAKGIPEMPEEWVLLEFKTHSKTSFNDLVKKGVKDSKPQHFGQMQIYMHYKELRHALYMAVCKDNDHLHLEIVRYDERIIPELQTKARLAIYSERPPSKVSTNPAAFACRFCDFSKICHFGESPQFSCRSCGHLQRGNAGQWSCALHGLELDKEALIKGCDEYKISDGFG